jgi:hypothetical protein
MNTAFKSGRHFALSASYPSEDEARHKRHRDEIGVREGGKLPPHPQDERQGRGPIPKVPRVRKVKRARGETLKWLGMQGLRAAGFLFAAWALACVFHPGARPF